MHIHHREASIPGSSPLRLAPLVGLLSVVVILLTLIAVPPLTAAHAEQLSSQLDTAQQLADRLHAVEHDMQQMQAALRGYLLTDTSAYLEQYQAPQPNLATHLEQVRDLAQQVDPELVPQVTTLEAIVARWQRDGGTRQISLLQQGRRDDVRALVADGSSQAIFDTFRAQIDELQRQSQRAQLRLTVEMNQVRVVQTGLTTTLGALGLIAVVIVIGSFRRTANLVRALQDAQAHAAELTGQVQEQLRDAEQRNRQLTAFHTVASASALTIQPEQRARNVLHALCDALDFQAGALWTLDDAAGLRLLALVPDAGGAEANPASPPQLELMPDERQFLATVARDAAAIVCLSEHDRCPAAVRALLSRLAPQAERGVVLPLQSEAAPIGLLVLAAQRRVGPGSGDATFLGTLATEVSLVLKNALLYEAAQTERQRLQVVFDHSPQGIIAITAPDGQIALANHAAVALFGEALQEPGAQLAMLSEHAVYPNGTFCMPDDLPLARALREGSESCGVELIVQQPAGQQVPVLMTSVPTFDAEGVLRGAVAVFHDLRQLREVERLKSDFVALVSHELRTPLTIIKGSAQNLLALDGVSLSPLNRELAQIIAAQSERLHELVDNLLNLSQVEAGTLRVQRELVTLTPLIRRVVRQLRERLGDLRVQTNLPTNLPLVSADERRIEQVLFNLLDNARKFSPPSGVVTIEAATNDDQVVVSVRDQGPGVPAAERERVFERFYQVEQPATRRVGGTGLGLAICKSIVEAHDGTIWVEEASGGGALVRFSLPALPQAEAPPARTPMPLLARPQHEAAQVLVVDDDPALRRLIEVSLPPAGYRVQAVAEAEAALEAVTQRPPDLILLDLMLPGVDGFALCRQLREWTQVPIVMLTARASEQDIVRGLQLGADDYVTKPFRPNELLARLEAVLRRATPERQAGGLSVIQVGELVVDLAQRRVTVGGAEALLTPTEYRLLALLARHPGQVLTHQQILQEVWGSSYSGENHYLWVHMAHLRQKIEADSKQPRYLLTERGVGYRLAKG